MNKHDLKVYKYRLKLRVAFKKATIEELTICIQLANKELQKKVKKANETN